MKKVILSLIICCFIFSGCSEESKERFNAFFNSPVYNNYSGTYLMQGNEEGEQSPILQLDMSSLNFVYTYDMSSEYLLEGNIERKGGMLVLTTHEEKYIYVFQILDRYTLQFKKEYSSKIEGKNSDIDIKDGTIFSLSEEEKIKIQKKIEKEEEEEDNFIYWAY